MTRNRICGWMMIGIGVSLLAACGTDTVKPDQEITLQPGYGIAAVGFDTLDSLNNVAIKSADDKGQEIDVAFIDKGVNLFVYVVPEGTYCLRMYHTGSYEYWPINSHDDCFDVVAGKVAFSGNYTPRVYNGDVRTDQIYDWDLFKKVFKDRYPKLASYAIVTP